VIPKFLTREMAAQKKTTGFTHVVVRVPGGAPQSFHKSQDAAEKARKGYSGGAGFKVCKL
jgi:hypothetical protein